MRSLQEGDTRRLSELADAAPATDEEVTVRVHNGASGLRRVATTVAEFVWEIAPSDVGRFADLAQVVGRSDRPCHHYLDAHTGVGLTVKVSKDEYPDDFLPQN
jgi:hypothetical protein